MPNEDKTELDELLEEKAGAGDEPESKPGDAAGAGETGGDGEGDKAPVIDADSDKAVIESLRTELAEMRGIFRSQRQQTELLKAELGNTKKQLEESGTLTPPSEEDKKALETAQAARRDQLEDYLENMRLSPKFGDVDEVVSQRRADDIIEIMGKDWAAKNNIPSEAGIKAVTDYVWLQVKNPYRFLYEKIKQSHPDFVKAAPDGAGKKGAPSLANLGAGDGNKGKGGPAGWTAERILALAENRLHEVPADIYAKFMRGELD